jgi:twitching motility protein PilT
VIDVFPPNQQAQIRAMFAESIQAIITQTLCKKVGGGRQAALEILLGTTAVRNLIREGKIHQIPSVMQISQNVGMQTLEMHLRELVDRNLITKETAIEKTGNADMFKEQEQALAQSKKR